MLHNIGHVAILHYSLQESVSTGRSRRKRTRKAVPKIETQPPREREQWSNPREFLLSCIAMSVGLGNVWRFPFVALENGGGAFLVLYIFVLFFIGRPLYYMELCMGQFSSLGSAKVWEMSPAFRGVGYGQAIAAMAVVTYCVFLMGLTVHYFFASFASVLPWAECGNWSDNYCVDVNNTEVQLGINSTDLTSVAEEYFSKKVLNLDPLGLSNGLGNPEWRLMLCLLLSWVILFMVLIKGVHSSGKAAYFFVIFPYFVLIVMLVRGTLLQGALEGFLFFITPRWEKLMEPEVLYAAIHQSFFSLSVGFGSVMMFSSFNKFRYNFYRDTNIICIADTVTSLLAGITTFVILGHLAEELGVDIEHVIKSGGTSLMFVSYPDVLSRFQYVPQLFSVMFFLMLFTLGLGTASALINSITTIICDDFPHLKKQIATVSVCTAGFYLGLFYATPQGQFVLELVNHYGGGFIVFVLMIVEIVGVHWVYGVNNFCRDIDFMLGRKTGLFWKISWAFLIPLLLSVVFIYGQITGKPLAVGSYVFEPLVIGVGICLAVLACLMVPIFFVVEVSRRRDEDTSVWQAVVKTFKTSDEWCPRDPDLRQGYSLFTSAAENTTPV
nr:sodium-dependent nutrient amino acid transporter 1-like [Cherax quadricarinatus]